MSLLDPFWTILYLFLLAGWIWLLITVLGDVFSSDLSGWAKAGWAVFVVGVPWLGVLVYLIVHGGDTQLRSRERAAAAVQARAAAGAQAQADYIASVAVASTSTGRELSELATLRHAGVISDREYRARRDELLT